MASTDREKSNASPFTESSKTADTVNPSRRYRYSRSSTASVTQLLSDRCNSLLQRFRRNPSENPEKKSSNAITLKR